MKKLYNILMFLAIFTFILNLASYAAPVPTAAELERARQLSEQEKTLREKIETEKPKAAIEKETPEQHAPVSTAKEKTLIKNITVIGVTLLPDKEINKIITPYKNKELTMGDMQTIANLITDAYRQKGYITSRAYLPPQKIENNSLEIRILEGLMGDVQVKGNRFFRASLIKRKISLEKGQPFNYDTLRSDMVKINELPDRSAKAVLTPGKEAGTTDLLLEVKDRLPIHVGFDWDNFGSRYIDGQRYSVSFVDNNLTGLDDKLTFQSDGTLTIGQRPATVIADPQSKTYGDANPAPLTATVTGTVNSDILDYTLGTSATQFSNVGPYPITVTLGSNLNYTVTPTDGTLTINAAPQPVLPFINLPDQLRYKFPMLEQMLPGGLIIYRPTPFDMVSSSDLSGPTYFYQPLTPTDITAFDSQYNIEDGAYDFMSGSINMKGHDGLLPMLEGIKKKRKPRIV